MGANGFGDLEWEGRVDITQMGRRYPQMGADLVVNFLGATSF